MHIMRMRSRSSASTHVAKREYNLFSEINEEYFNQFGNLLEPEACRVKPDRFEDLTAKHLIGNFKA
jgi:hypothetical protein